jgi:phenylacetate-CoA ligase
MIKNDRYFHSFYSYSPPILKNSLASAYSILTSLKKYGRTYEQWRKILNESQYYGPEKLHSFQENLYSAFLTSVNSLSPFYSEIIKANNIDIRHLREIKKFPIINKAIVKENYKSIIPDNFESLKKYKFSSSGTTGTSLHVYMTPEAYEREYAFRWHYLSIGGAGRKDKFAYFLGNNLYPTEQDKPPFHIIDYFENSIYFSLFHLSEKNLTHYLKDYNTFKPDYIKGYPSGLYAFAKYISEHNSSVHFPKAIFTASETLLDTQKKIIEEVFQARIFQWYGQVETTVNIHECEHHKFHVKEEYGFLELLNEQGNDALPGEVASVIGTGWGNTAFPLIRYDTGDNMILANDQTCKCGRTGRIIEKILGRDEDVIITPEGRHVGRLDFIFKPIENVVESQIIQESTDEIHVKIVPGPNFKNVEFKEIEKILFKYLGNHIKIRIEIVDEIERSANGKIRYVISKVKPVQKK